MINVAKRLALAIAGALTLVGVASAAASSPGWAWTPAYASNVVLKQDPAFGVPGAKITAAQCDAAGAAVTPFAGHFISFKCSVSYILGSQGNNAPAQSATVWMRVSPSGFYGIPCASDESLDAIAESCLEVRSPPTGGAVSLSPSQSTSDWTPWYARAMLQRTGWKGASSTTVEGCSGVGAAVAIQGLPAFHYFDCRFLGNVAGQTARSHLLRLRVTGSSSFVASDLRVAT